MADETKRVPTKVRVTTTVKRRLPGDKGPIVDSELSSDELEEVEIHQFATQPAVVKFSYPFTKSLNFQSITVAVGVELPCYVEEIEEGLDRAQQIVINRMKKLKKQVDGVLDRLVDENLQAMRRINEGTWEPRK